eukprot:89064-Rhodomonas_salina.1
MAARMWTLECEPSFQNAGWERMSEPESRLCACSFETASSTCESAWFSVPHSARKSARRKMKCVRKKEKRSACVREEAHEERGRDDAL